MINTIIFLNGIYDLICGFFFLNIHQFVFKEEFRNDIMKRILAYWLITYGIIRIFIIKNRLLIDIKPTNIMIGQSILKKKDNIKFQKKEKISLV